MPVALEGAGKQEHWADLRRWKRRAERFGAGAHPVAIRSPHHPAQAHRTFFGYGHRFEAYVPKEKRLFGYFALPVLVGDDIVAALDLKTDRKAENC